MKEKHMAQPVKTRIKAKAKLEVPQSRDELAQYIKRIGDMNRKMQCDTAEMNDAIAHITQTYQPRLDAQKGDINLCQEGVQAYCEANRDELTNGRKIKTVNLITGEIAWRINPPSVRISKVKAVVEMLKRLKLNRFLREKTEINKDAIALEPEAVRDLAGITIVSGVEEFIITPFEQEAA